MRVAYFDCRSGISGDMILGALVDLGVDIRAIRKGLKQLDLSGYTIKASTVKRGLVCGAKVDVRISRLEKKHHSRRYSQIKKMLESSSLSAKIKTKAIKVFTRLGRAEAEVHGTSINKVHFHEVGAVDSIVDIVGGVLGLELLNVDAIFSSPLNIGEGSVNCMHGNLPVPAPATLKILEGIPCYSDGTEMELTTPTGAAIISSVAKKFISLPLMKIVASGYGAGDNILEGRPNMLRIILGEMQSAPATHDFMTMIETNIDDMNPEFYEHVMELLFDAGAVDVFLTPIIMKKNRPAVKLSALVPTDKRDLAALILLSETSTFGTRFYDVGRVTLKRHLVSVKTPYGQVKVKVGKLNGTVMQCVPEYEECKRIAKKRKIPLKTVYANIVRIAEGKG